MLNLEKDDLVWVQIDYLSSGVNLFDNVNHYTHFMGFMLEEEIIASFWDIFLKCKKWWSTDREIIQSTRVEFLDKKLDENLTVYVYVIRNTQSNFVFIKF